MAQALTVRILLPQDLDAILAYAKAHHLAKGGDEIELELNSWTARWRQESLTHYLGLGWSFGVFQENQCRGIILAQPLLFYRGLTQTLWVEELLSETSDAAHLLLETVSKWARDKHFQCVLMEGVQRDINLENFKNVHVVDQRWVELRTARF